MASAAHHEDAYVQALFDQMGPTYAVMNVVSSFAFSEWWRRSCVRGAKIEEGALVCDMMAGSGECWSYLRRRGAHIVSIDFSSYMSNRQRDRRDQSELEVDVRCENATSTSLKAESMDAVISAFGLKTLSDAALGDFARELSRILKPGGCFSLLEISVPSSRWLQAPYGWYIGKVVPWLGKLFLGDIECYRMLGIYTREFGSCDRVLHHFEEAGLSVVVKSHFFGCATSLVGSKPS